MKWRKPDERVIQLLHDAMPAGDQPIEFKPMFGGPCYWVGGNMVAAVHQEGLFVRLGEEDRAELLALPGARLFEPMEGRRMKEYVVLPETMLDDVAQVRAWLAKGVAYAATLPPKEKKPRAKPR